MKTFTSSLPNDLIKKLNDASRKRVIPKNKIIEKALQIYLDQLNKAEYIKSYRVASTEMDILEIAEEGMIDYLKQLDQFKMKD